MIAEGEKAAEVLNRRGVLALGTVTGAAAIPNRDVLAVFLPFRVVLWPDNDDGGSSHMQRIAASLANLGHRDVRLLAWPDAPAKGDASVTKRRYR